MPSSSLRTSIAMVLALASLSSAMQIEADTSLDTTWPTEYCCRLYGSKKFSGKTGDFCTDNDTDAKEFNFEQIHTDWDNKMSSWKCGSKVAVNFCTRSNEHKCFEDHNYGESAGGHAESQDTGINNSLTMLKLTPYNPEVLSSITVFNSTKCHKRSSVLWGDVSYEKTDDQLTIGNNIKSVMVPSGKW